ncbi:hypothetical protein B484DRAFT_180766, partial [Ochromonadaceae sp. CCMP2298]
MSEAMASIKVVVVIKPRAEGEQGPVGVLTDVPGQVQVQSRAGAGLSFPLTCLRGKASHNGKVGTLCEDSHTGRVGTLFALSGLKRELDDLAAARRAGAHLAASPDLVVIAYGRSGSGKTQALFGDGSEHDMPGLGGLIGYTLVEMVQIAKNVKERRVKVSAVRVQDDTCFDLLIPPEAAEEGQGQGQEQGQEGQGQGQGQGQGLTQLGADSLRLGAQIVGYVGDTRR